MKPHDQTVVNRIGKSLANPLSQLVANSKTEGLAQLAEAYWCILLGKGAGTGWGINAEIKAAQSTIRRASPVVFDVGANVGEWSTLFHRLCPQARIFLFEPQPACQKVISERNIPNSVLIPGAASSCAGHSIKLFSSAATDVTASLHQRRDTFFSDRTFTPIDVDTVTIDDVVREHDITRVDFMKMDVEGHELAVLQGAMKSLQAGKIQALSFEFGGANINSRTFFHDFWDLLIPLGFSIFRILPSSRLMPIREYYEDCEYFRGATNYIASLQQASA